MWPPRSCLWLALVLCLLLVGVAQGQSSSREHFEDADKSSEYTDQQYDLRHTIPGEPGLDYPILSAPPKTSFVCKGRHEGYYADVESRCQAFRICAHTARIPQGFGFLCPNGTLFSQKNFVCDWYRNVNCDDSERYYEMNEEKSVGNTHEMMERVRHMMEYPMKTISKALQQTQSQSQNPHHSLSKDLSGASGVLSQPAVVKSNDPQETQVVGRGEAVKSEPLNAVKAGITTTDENEDEGIYVNSLGELSSDPGIQFDHTNAHIVAEYPREYHYQKQKNFAERVNAGLDVLTDTETPYGEVMAPDYIKHIRNTKDEAVQLDLVSNINNLLDEVSTDVDPSVSGYQSMAPPKVKQPFRFLSRGFSMQGENGKGSSSSTGYGYIKPKQTPSTVRFTPNEIPTEDHKSIEHKHKFSKTASSSTSTTTTESVEKLLIAPTLPPAEFAEDMSTTSVAPETITSTSAAEPLSFLAPPPPAEVLSTGDVATIESIGQAAALTASLPISEDINHVEQSPENAEKNDVHHEAAKLLLAGVQLTSHDEDKSLERNDVIVTSTTTTSSPITPVMQTSTEVVTEISSTQERIRGYRKNRPGAMLKRAHIRPLPIVRTTTPSTTQKTTSTTRSYLERLAASRLRLSRLSQATRSTTKPTTTTTTVAPSSTTTPPTTTTTTTISPFQQIRGAAEPGPNKKLTVRDIERETKIAPSKASWESVHSNLQRFQVQRGNRVYTPATRASVSSGITSSSTTTPRTYVAATSARSTVSSNRGKSRYSNFKTQAPVQRTRGTTTPRSTTVRPTSSLASLNQHISALASNYNGGYSYTQAPQISKPIQPSHVYATQAASEPATYASPSQLQSQSQSQSQTTSSLSPASAFLSFDKLTRAIVDESVLQNFKSAQSQGSHQQQQQQQHQQQRQQQHQAVKQQHHSVSSSYVKPAAAPAISSLTVPPRPQQAAQVSELPPPPGIVIARAEGQRIAPNSASNIISSLATQAPVTNGQSNSYVSLNDFLNNKFGQSPASSNNIAPAATLQQHQQQHYQQQRVQKQPVQQQHVQLQQRQSVQQQQRQPIQQQHLAVQQQQQPVQQQHQQQLSFISQQYQQPQQHNAYQQYQQPQQQHQRFQQQQHFQQRPTIHTNQQPYLTPNIFVPYQQQQQQLPQFPPLAPPVAVSPGNIAQGPVIAGRHVDHLNVQLPTLGNGLIPGLQLAQKRSDVSASQLQLTDAPGKGSLSGSGKSRERAFYAGRTSYEVPQSSVGRLPNDVTQQMRRRLRRF
ncbi:serine-rich adhesin for platelets isoform X1 [Drosophila elegans]|uniref:serine-rich adhesin for platelets isoform X1 n=1 Tax=Drosophila elegans TaxID=30023 RepID=UPI0007E6F648|nr:serine-rich adhesin for platelets isoform X1 [Drosophila elegans]